jgi:large subunit ribosomal protein L4
MLESLRGDNRKTMMVLPEHDSNVYLSGRNLSNHQTVALSDMNTYDLTHTQVVIFTESAAKMFSEEQVEETAA